ncbi:hypothetical protein BZA05DRAFT_432917 [Tricharina praecox]|uniref:uncharacterized protein n=1 Tax=Tricharina praecox TaxID=43433 RepID=UPI00221F1BD2|nr:uncharacterized protein BZA05DRAFT_432917 [Tricharina praecox]KAI5859155.1 hypothetical protein BZA05DRAFT_432917 [Tricharina praecox]
MSSRPGSRSGSSGPDQPVVDLSLIGRWDPKDGTNTADVTPPQQQHSLRIPFLHLQPLVLQSTLAPYDDGSPEDPLPNLMPPLTFDEMDLSSVEGFGGVRLGEVEVEDSSRQDKTISADEQQEEASSIVSSPFPERGRWLPRDHAASTSPEPGVAPFAMAGRRCVSYTRTYDGVMQRVPLGAHEWDRIQKCAERIQRVETPVATRDRAANVAFTPRVDSRGRIISSGSYNSIRSVSPLTAHLAQRLQHGDIDHSVDEEEMAELLPHGHDGPGEFRDKVRGKLRGVRHVMFSEDRHSESESEDKNAEDDEITIAVEDNSLVVCFLQHVRPDPVVIEILLKVRPILLGQNKNYHTFIFSGLPYCRNPAFFDFRVDRDDEEWVFDAGDHDQTATFEPLVLDEPNRLRGQLHLRDATPTQRSIIMRAQRVPSHVEIYGHKIRSKTNALFSWTPDGHVVAEFEIKVYLIDVDVADNVARNMINLILVNGVDDPKEITVNSASGRREKFSLEGPVMKDGEELQSARLLQVSRLVRDSRDSMTISFRKVQESFPCYFHIPLVETGSHRDILEQIVVIHEPRLPLTLAFTPDLSFWRDLGEEKDLLGSRKITRIVDSSAIEYPRVWVNSLEPVCSTAIAVLGKFRNLGFVDKLTYQIEEHSPALWSARNPISLHLRMSFEIEGPVKNGAELSRVHRGLFQVEFITINGAPAKMAFMDEDELVILNHGHEYETVPMKFSVYWVSMQPHTTDTIGGGKMLEFQLPRIHEKLVGRAVCKYPHGPAQITSRSHLLDTPPPDAGPWTVVFTNGKATLSGLQTFSSRMYLQIPAESSRWPPKSRAGSIIADADSLAEGLVFRNSAHDEASSLDGPASTTRLPSPDPSPFSFDGAYSPPSTLRHLSTDFGPNPFAVAVEHKDQGSSDGPTPQEEAMGCLRRVFLLLLIAVTFLGCYYCYMDLGGQSFWAPQSRFHPYQATARSSYERLENLLMEGYADILHDEAPPPTQDHWRGIYTPEPLSVVPATPDADEPAIESGSPTEKEKEEEQEEEEEEQGNHGVWDCIDTALWRLTFGRWQGLCGRV